MLLEPYDGHMAFAVFRGSLGKEKVGKLDIRRRHSLALLSPLAKKKEYQTKREGSGLGYATV